MNKQTKYFVCAVFEITQEEFGLHSEEKDYFCEYVLDDLVLHSNSVGIGVGKFKYAWVQQDD